MTAADSPGLAPVVMIQGCTSDAGKSLLVAALCRWFADSGVRVVPFKAQNMSNNAAVCADGGEIGLAQYLQAVAARVEPDVRMNPILLKPTADTASSVILLGRPAPELTSVPWGERRSHTWPVVKDALRSLRSEFDDRPQDRHAAMDAEISAVAAAVATSGFAARVLSHLVDRTGFVRTAPPVHVVG